MTVSIAILSIMALNTESHYAECHLWSVANMPIMLIVFMVIVVMLNVVAPREGVCKV
jgi:hypothetical protein